MSSPTGPFEQPAKESCRPFTFLSISQILAWADAHHARTGRWPSKVSGPIRDAPGQTWAAVDAALKFGRRGLARGSSLARLLQEQRQASQGKSRPLLTEAQILAWADAHYVRTGRWPSIRSGPVEEAPGEDWGGLDYSLAHGGRALPGGSSLARLLDEQRGANRGPMLPELTEAQILTWADAHRARTGQWPSLTSGPIPAAPGEYWAGVWRALVQGQRGLLGGFSLAVLLAVHRGVGNHHALTALTEEQIRGWADAHFARTGPWPDAGSGSIEDSTGETWRAVEQALRNGGRGLAGHSSLARLLATRRPVENRRERPPLTVARVLAWADAYHQRTGQWPEAGSGPIPEAPGETWAAINASLVHGDRGLPGGCPLPRFLVEYRGAWRRRDLPDLSVEQILAWIDAYWARHGRWPQTRSGAIEQTVGETWLDTDTALRQGERGLPGGSSLARLIHEQCPDTAALPRDERIRAATPATFRKQFSRGLDEGRILAWADTHHAQTGQWPTQLSGPVLGAPGEKWCNIDTALRRGQRRLPGGSSLARMLAQHRDVRNIQDLPPFTEAQILAWADAYYARTGEWPSPESGPIEDAPGETWKVVAASLLQGKRGLPGGSSLSQLLAEHRGVWNSHAAPPLTEAQILAWADAHRERTGRWPTLHSGPVADAPGERWSAVEAALTSGCRGLPGGSSVARLLAVARGVPNPADRSPLTLDQILAWADAHHARTGRWPNRDSGPIDGATEESWAAVDSALLQGIRGLPGGFSLPRLLAEQRAARFNAKAPDLSEARILAWADAHYARTGQWPGTNSGSIREAPSETWAAVKTALTLGYRGLPGGSSLAKLLAEQRGLRNIQDLPPLTEAQILAWAAAFFDRAGRWPTTRSGPIAGTAGETWAGVDGALGRGARGLPEGSSLVRLLAARRQARNPLALPALTVEQVLAWADAHYARAGLWPTRKSGPIETAPGETWSAVDTYLMHGKRGLPGGSSLLSLLAEHRGVRHRLELPDLSVEQILTWADAYHARHGRWPKAPSGPVDGAPGETWSGIQHALHRGKRGLPQGSSLPRLLAEHRGARNHLDLPSLTTDQILAWSDAFRAGHGHWPQVRSGPIPEAPGETWSGVEAALDQGHRGLPGGSSLLQLLAERRGARAQRNLRLLDERAILAWADAFRQRHGAWPQKRSGAIPEAPEESWMGVNVALRQGYRGLAGGSSLSQLIKEHRKV